MTGQGGTDGSLAAHGGRSTDSGKSRLLVSEALAAPSAAAGADDISSSAAPTLSGADPSSIRGAFTGESLARQLRRTVVPLPPEFLSGIDAHGHAVDPDVEEVEKRMALYSLLIEYSFCPQYAPEGVYCMPSWDNLRIWHGVIIIRHGIYRGGVFKYKITVSDEYPRQAPALVFLSRVHHVLVDPKTGELNLQVLFPQWKNDDYLPMVLMYLKSIFFRKELLEGTANESHWRNLEAVKAMQEDKKKVLEDVRQCVKESQQQLYNKTAGVDFVFDFHAFHREHKPIFNALNVLAHDATCVDPTAAFLDWFLDDYCRSEFQGAAPYDPHAHTAVTRKGQGGTEGKAHPTAPAAASGSLEKNRGYAEEHRSVGKKDGKAEDDLRKGGEDRKEDATSEDETKNKQKVGEKSGSEHDALERKESKHESEGNTLRHDGKQGVHTSENTTAAVKKDDNADGDALGLKDGTAE